jgi:Helix-turn-helix domain
MNAEAEPIFVLGEKSAAFAALHGRMVTTASAVREALGGHRRAKWLARRSSDLALLVSALETRDTWHRLLLLEEPTTARRELLATLFRVVVAPGNGVRLLAREDLIEVLTADHPEDYFIGGVVDREDKVLVLYRGNLERLVVPFKWFRAGRASPRPDFEDFEVTDSGQTIRLGEYEAAADAILYELDPEARRRIKSAQVEKDETFGGALRRLRLARGLSRDDFPGVNGKTIARIERGEVEKPHGETLAKISEALGVGAEEIEAY